jgi:toxin ParE2
MLSIKYLPAAKDDFDQSFNWYAARSDVAAVRFAEAVDAALFRISQDPESLPQVHLDFHECRLIRFPFRVIFRRSEDHFLIIAIAHAKRRPSYWVRRL